MNEVKITGLSPLNVRAINEVWPDGVMVPAAGDSITVTTTTAGNATFTRTCGGPVPAGNLLACIQHGMNRCPMNAHPRQSLHVLRRKIVAVLAAESIEAGE